MANPVITNIMNTVNRNKTTPSSVSATSMNLPKYDASTMGQSMVPTSQPQQSSVQQTQQTQQLKTQQPSAMTTPAAQNYMSSISGQPTVDSLRTQLGTAQTALDKYIASQQQPVQPTQPTQPVQQPNTSQSAYLKYLTGQFSDENTTKARKEQEDALKRLADIQTKREQEEYNTRKQYESMLERTGIGKSAAQDEAAYFGRKNESKLADIALQESAAARSAQVAQGVYNQYIQAGASLYEAEQAAAKAQAEAQQGFTLGEKQTRFEYDPQTGQYKQVAGGAQEGVGGAYSPGMNPIADAYADAVLSGKTKLENIPEQYRGMVAQAIAGVSVTPETSPYLAQIATQGKQAISGLKEIAEANPGIFGRTAALPLPGSLRSDAYRNYEAQLDYLRGNLIPASLTAMREASKTGGALGQVSDREGAWLASALGALSMTQSKDAIVKQLGLIEESLSRWENAVNQYGNSGSQQLTPDETQYLKSRGYSDEEIRQLTGFNSVGNTTASNIPQKNKNPGNIKSGGLADSLAIGKDSQGHLIFPDEQTGFRAMQMDIQAKIDGQSRYLPPNPTLAQLGKVYAEDPNWTNSVARILGISPTTPTKSIPISNLVQAIARQEGYYA